LHTKPHDVPSHVAVALAGAVHGVQDVVPHDAVLELLAQAAPQVWKPTLQANPHDTPSHVAVEFAGGEQAVHDVDPHVFVLELLTHNPAQRW